MAHAPSQQDIQDHLNGLNRVWKAALVSADTAAAKAKGIHNYRHWFRSHGIAIDQDAKSRVWKVQKIKHE